jgi:hypothetical protein
LPLVVLPVCSSSLFFSPRLFFWSGSGSLLSCVLSLALPPLAPWPASAAPVLPHSSRSLLTHPMAPGGFGRGLLLQSLMRPLPTPQSSFCALPFLSSPLPRASGHGFGVSG